MKFLTELNKESVHGILFVGLFALAAMQVADITFIHRLGVSPLLIGIIIGMLYAFTLRNHLPKTWVPGILFSSKQILRLAIILYGFRLSFQQVAEVGLIGFIISTFMVASTMVVGALAGKWLFKLDKDTSILVASGAAVCGAAAVLATETTLNSKPYKSAIAVATVVLFGTLAMFLYPALHAMHLIHLDGKWFGLFVGATVHEVAQVVAAGSAVVGASDTAIVVKMTRVMLLAPMLIILGLMLKRDKGTNGSLKNMVPWFAVGFIAMVGFNSFHWLPESWIMQINHIDTFLLTMAMTALGMETNAEKFKAAGAKPLLLAAVLFIWLFTAGLSLVSIFSN